MVYRIYVEKRDGFDVEARHLADELRVKRGRKADRLREHRRPAVARDAM